MNPAAASPAEDATPRIRLTSRASRLTVWHLALALATLAFHLWQAREHRAEGYYSPEALIREAQARDLFGDDSRGYRGLIASALWSPVPTLVVAPFVTLSGDWPPGALYQILTSLIAGLGAVWLARCLVLFLRAPVWLACLAAMGLYLIQAPPFTGWAGQWPVFLALFFFMSLFHTGEFLRTGNVAELIVASIAAAALLLVSPVMVVWVAALAYWIGVSIPKWEDAGFTRENSPSALDQQRAAGRAKTREAMLILFLTPALYPLALWALFNWLILGRPFEFLTAWGEGVGGWGAMWIATTIGGAAFLMTLAAGAKRMDSARRLLPISAAAVVVFLWQPALGNLNGATTYQAHICPPGGVGLNSDGAAIVERLNASHGGAIIVVTGYTGYEWRTLNNPDVVMLHRVEFDRPAILRDTVGRDVLWLATRDQYEREKRRVSDWRRRMPIDHQFDRWVLARLIRDAEYAESDGGTNDE